jgi:hypothetical protein
MNAKTFGKLGAAVAVSGAALIFSATSASAYVVCNDRGDCWHESVKYVDPGVHLTFYNDSWDWKAHNYRWHEVSNQPGYWDADKDTFVVTKKTTTTTTTTTSTPE